MVSVESRSKEIESIKQKQNSSPLVLIRETQSKDNLQQTLTKHSKAYRRSRMKNS